ncbi:MAG: hypothetical protein WCE58_13665 [Gallionella sp.]
MAKINKATVGILFSEKMFRITSVFGSLTDDLLALSAKGIIADTFKTIGRDVHNSQLQLYNKETGVYFSIDLENITYTKDLYDSEANYDFAGHLAEFEALWKVMDSRLKFPSIRRIGYVTEQRVHAGETSNKLLVEKLSRIKPLGFTAKFLMTFEDRINVGYGGLPDPTKDDFINIIRAYYDSAIDAQHPEVDSINANLDVQRYYNPYLKGEPFADIKKLKKEYDKVALKFNDDLTMFGTDNAKAA